MEHSSESYAASTPGLSSAPAATRPAAVLSLRGARACGAQQSPPPSSSSSSSSHHLHDCASLEHIFRQLLSLVRFLKRHVAMGDHVRLTQISLALWPRLAEAVVDKCLSQASGGGRGNLGLQSGAHAISRWRGLCGCKIAVTRRAGARAGRVSGEQMPVALFGATS